ISWTGKKVDALGVTWPDRIKEWFVEGWHKFYTAMKDQGHYLDLMVRDAARRGYKSEVGDDAYAIFKAFTQSGPTLAMTALEKGVFKLSGEMEKIGPSLHEVFEKIEEKDYERFVEWIWSRHAIEAWSKGKNPGGSLVDAHAFYQKYRSDEWEQAAQKLTDFNNSLIVMLADAGVITPKAAKAMIEYYQTYIPLMRVKNPMKRGRFGGKKLVNLPNPVHGRHGSGEQVLDPIQSTIERAIRMYERGAQQIVINKAVQMAHKADGIGTWIHNVPPDFRTTGFTVGEIEDQLAKVGIDIFDYEELVNQRSKEKLKKEKGDDYDENEVEEFHVDPQELLYVYRPDYYYKGSEPIAQVIVNGKPKLYQFDKDLFRAISGMNYFQLPYFMDLLMGKGTRMIRMGATGINIGFAERNVIKDAFTYLAQSNESLASTRRAIPLPAPGTMMGAYIWSETQKLLGNEADPVVELWQQMGGELSQTLGLDRNQIRKAVKDVVANSTQRRLLNVAATPLETMRQIIGISEVSPRLSEFYAVLERHGYTREKLTEMRALGKRPPRHILVEASNAAADVTTDFKRQGWLGKWLNRVSPYWNAPLEGLDKYVRTWKVNPKRALIFSAAYAAARIAYWMMVKDEDWYKEQPKWLKYGFWTIA
ncbi:MAG: hypothetical protein Q7T18_04895, partial [Sedimentisphaerales bacterium]|nr:hypothetical protein [Sedimentisphaerales bacterium]